MRGGLHSPVRHIEGNLAYASDGSIWAIWRMEAVPYDYLSHHERLSYHGRVRAALSRISAETWLVSVCAPVDIDSTLERIRSTPVADVDRWMELTEDAGQVMEEVMSAERLWSRRFYAYTKLPSRNKAMAALTAFSVSLERSLFGWGAVPPPPYQYSESQKRRHRAAAGAILSQMGNGLGLSEAAPEEIRWLLLRAHYRATADDPPPERVHPPHRGQVSVADVKLYEGGRADDPDRPRHRRYLRVDTERSTAYHTYLVAAQMPDLWHHPGREWWVSIDSLPFPCDWAIRLNPISTQRAMAAAQRKARALAQQEEEYEGEAAGAPPHIAEAAAAINDQRLELAESGVPELRSTLIFSLADENLEVLEYNAEILVTWIEGWEWRVARPSGAQTALWKCFFPGSTAPQVVRQYSQWLMPSGVASGAPTAFTEVGDPSGMLIGFGRDSGCNTPVLLDPARGPRTNRSGSMGIFGALGSGKSFAIKQIGYGTVCAGGRVVCLDRTSIGEYVRFAEVMPGKSQVVDLANIRYSLDPMRMFPDRRDKERYTSGFLSQMCGVEANTDQSSILGLTVQAAVEVGLPISEIHRILDGGDKTSMELAAKLQYLTNTPFAQVVFDPNREPLSFESDYIVFWLRGLTLPDQERLRNPALAKQLLPEEVFSQALLYLLTAVAYQSCFEYPGFAAVQFDEAWALTSSPHGQALLQSLMRDGRKHNAAVWLLSQHPRDLGDSRLTELLGTRMVFAQGGGAGEEAVKYLGLEPDKEIEEMVEMEFSSGDCLMRDVDGRFGRVKIAAISEAAAIAAGTTPEEIKESDELSGEAVSEPVSVPA